MSQMELQDLVKDYGQDHLLKYYEGLNDEEKESFSKELMAINFSRVKKLCDIAINDLNRSQEKKDHFMEVISSDHVGKKSTESAAVRQKWWDEGLKQISEGAVAVILLAGGQGTRLGVDYPKGMYDVGLPSKKTLYQLQAERICKLQQLAEQKFAKKCRIKWYIMTSDATLKSTRDYFERHSYFGLEGSNVRFFEQHQLPCLTFEGKLILSSKGSVARAPDGNGGLYAALKSNDIIGDMEDNGIKHVQVYCVDNILARVADPYFTGFVVERDADCANKVIEKIDPYESVGVTCKCKGKIQVVEYSEISPETAEKKAEDGSLLYKDSNICLHYFRVDFLKRVVNNHLDELPHHIAKKKIPFVGENGELVKPTAPNGMKLEKFVFDVFEFSKNFVVFEVERSEEFSPLKNGPDNPKSSPVSCFKDISNLHSGFLLTAGAKFVKENGATAEESDTVCEISPLLSYAGEGLESYADETFQTGSIIHLEHEKKPSPSSSPSSKKLKM